MTHLNGRPPAATGRAPRRGDQATVAISGRRLGLGPSLGIVERILHEAARERAANKLDLNRSTRASSKEMEMRRIS
jgi:hypothetical protein